MVEKTRAHQLVLMDFEVLVLYPDSPGQCHRLETKTTRRLTPSNRAQRFPSAVCGQLKLKVSAMSKFVMKQRTVDSVSHSF